MLKDNWEEKHGISLPGHPHTTFTSGIQGAHARSSSRINLTDLVPRGPTPGSSIPRQSNLQDGNSMLAMNGLGNKFGVSINEQKSVEQLQFHQQKHLSENRQTFNANPHGNGAEKVGNSSHKSLPPLKSDGTDAGKSPIGINLQELMKFLSATHALADVEKIVGRVQKNDPIFGPLEMDEKNVASGVEAEKLWDGSLQLSSSVTLSAVAFFKSGEKLLGDNWPELIEVKGKVRLEAFEKYVQDLPRSRNRGLMVISLCWKEGSSDTGLAGMKEVAKGYMKSSRVGFAQLLSGTDLYICPRSDPIITILAKYGFFKGMSVIDDKQDSMIGCVVWRKNRPVEPQSSSSALSTIQGAEKKLSPEKLAPHAAAAAAGISKNVGSPEVDHYGGNPSSNSSSCNLVKKRPFEDDDLPEFDFGIVCKKSTLESQPPMPPVNHGSTVDPAGNSSLEQLSKKTKLFDDEDDDMPEWCPPELHKQTPPPKFQNLTSCPPRPPPVPPPPPPADTRSSFSYQPFRPSVSCPTRPPPTLPRAPPRPLPPPPSSSGGFSRHRPSPSNINQAHPSFNGRRPRP